MVANALGSEPLKSSGANAPFKQHLLRIQQDIKARQEQQAQGVDVAQEAASKPGA